MPDCPGHEIWARDFTGASGLFSFVLDGGDDAARTRLIDGLELFGIGYSWGGYREPGRARRSGADRDRGPTMAGPLVRLHIGLEDPDDLIADLAAGLAGYGAAAERASADASGLPVPDYARLVAAGAALAHRRRAWSSSPGWSAA